MLGSYSRNCDATKRCWLIKDSDFGRLHFLLRFILESWKFIHIKTASFLQLDFHYTSPFKVYTSNPILLGLISAFFENFTECNLCKIRFNLNGLARPNPRRSLLIHFSWHYGCISYFGLQDNTNFYKFSEWFGKSHSFHESACFFPYVSYILTNRYLTL